MRFKSNTQMNLELIIFSKKKAASPETALLFIL